MATPEVWHLRYGSWWMVQASFSGWLSLGVHVDVRRRHTNSGLRYGPYIDLHLGCVILSFGVNPAYSGEIEAACSVGRGGLRSAEN